MEKARQVMRGIAYAALAYVAFVGCLILKDGILRLTETNDMLGGVIWTSVGIVLIVFCTSPIGRAALRSWRRHRQMQDEHIAAYFRRRANEEGQ